jgi:quinol monooxygenase YgiN
MTNEKVIMLIEAKIQAQRRAELVEAAGQYLPLVRAEPGVEAFYRTTRKDDPSTFVFYEIYKSEAAQDFHLQQDFTNKFLATLRARRSGTECGQVSSSWPWKDRHIQCHRQGDTWPPCPLRLTSALLDSYLKIPS